jgi:hypothetical protein
LGGIDRYSLGISHLTISLWAVAISVIGLRRIVGVPAWLGLLVSFLSTPIALPFGIIFMRSPI